MLQKKISQGVAHKVPDDLRAALVSNAKVLAAWESLTPLARNEWICWTISVKMQDTREEHVARVISELKEGMRRPCCWMGCPHRTDKKISAAQKFVLGKRQRKSK